METGTALLVVGGVAVAGGAAYFIMRKRAVAKIAAQTQPGTVSALGAPAGLLPTPTPALYSGEVFQKVANTIGDAFSSKSTGSWFSPAGVAAIKGATEEAAARAAATAVIAANTTWVSNGEEFIGTPPSPPSPASAPPAAPNYDAMAAAAASGAAAAAAAAGAARAAAIAAAAAIGNVGSSAEGAAAAAASANVISIGAVLAGQKATENMVTSSTNAVASLVSVPLPKVDVKAFKPYVPPYVLPPPPGVISLVPYDRPEEY